jgi:hypothetical protein
MYIFIIAWLLVDLWSAIHVGDIFLLVMPLIFCCTTILIFLISESFDGRGILGGIGLVALNVWLLGGYPM